MKRGIFGGYHADEIMIVEGQIVLRPVAPSGGLLRLAISVYRKVGHAAFRSSIQPTGTDLYLTDGNFDIVKWKAQMSPYTTTNEVLLGSEIVDEPIPKTWGQLPPDRDPGAEGYQGA